MLLLCLFFHFDFSYLTEHLDHNITQGQGYYHLPQQRSFSLLAKAHGVPCNRSWRSQTTGVSRPLLCLVCRFQYLYIVAESKSQNCALQVSATAADLKNTINEKLNLQLIQRLVRVVAACLVTIIMKTCFRNGCLMSITWIMNSCIGITENTWTGFPISHQCRGTTQGSIHGSWSTYLSFTDKMRRAI